ncbi:MAG TPA: DUF885 domain-containing protein [Thermoanaerobaculia bacterium]|jgi:hypothetical protein|nr:DUF885 domain-containing protein [Thermoanaerobaculia bacterium]
MSRKSVLPRYLAVFALVGGLAASAGVATAATPAKPAPPAKPAWVVKSDKNAQILIDLFARFGPEGASQFGVDGYDDKITDLTPGFIERQTAATKEGIAELDKRLAAETDPAVRQDLEILIGSAKDGIEAAEVNERLAVPYFDIHQLIFQGVRTLLDDQVSPERRKTAVARLHKYAGLDPAANGGKPIAVLAADYTRSRLAVPGLLGPTQDEVEKSLQTTKTYADGIGELFAKYKITGYEKDYAAIKKQLDDYEAFVRTEVLPHSRTDFRLPPELYALSLKQVGVDMDVDELVSRAEVSFREIQNEMQTLAPLVAKEKGFSVTDYRDVLRELKKNQIVGEAILPHYEARIKDLERIIREGKIVTLPDRPMRIRLASAAESAAVPAPNMRPPRLIGNTGETGEFVLPLRIPGPDGKLIGFDDFTFDAASWTLTAHEGRPGHELQFAGLVEKGVSLARALFAFNSVNAEGWALYAEAEAKPYEPLDGQLVALQARLLRAARAQLDPGLQRGTITKEEATRVLTQDVVESDAMALQEVERYTFRSPGQATAYFCGYQRLMEMRTQVERTLGPLFNRQRFNDFILAQGLLPPSLLKKALFEEFVPREKAATATASR